MKSNCEFSVLMSCYGNDNPIFLDKAIASLFESTVQPSEIVLVVDGVIGLELENVIDKWQTHDLLKVHRLEKNGGLGKALAFGLSKCRYDLVARMDSDDINQNGRFKEQIQAFENDKDLVICGTDIIEFDEKGNEYRRVVPRKMLNIIRYSRLRNPMNHVTVMFRRREILAVGSYQSVLYFEDYFLWLKCLKLDYKMMNLPIVGVRVRAGRDMIGRRHGLSYIKHEWNFAEKSYREDLITLLQFSRILILRIPTRIMGKFFLRIVYKFLRM